MVFLDEHDVRIHASVRKTLVFKLFSMLREGDAYEMSSFGVGRNIGLCGNDFDTTYLVDVIDMLAGVGTEREYEKEGKLNKVNVIELQSGRNKIDCALFGSYVDQLNNFLASGDLSNAVVIVQFARVKEYKGKFVLQNSMYATKIFYNLDVHVVLEFKNSYDEYPNLLNNLMDTGNKNSEHEFLNSYVRKTIEELKDCKEDCTCIVMATVNQFRDEDDWWYTSCKCNRAVHPFKKGFFCQHCNSILLYKIKMVVIDDSDSCCFVIFDKEGNALLKKTCDDLVQTYLKNGKDMSIPTDLISLVGRTFLFKIEVKIPDNPNFEASFRVKRMSVDLHLIEKFNETNISSSDVDCTFGSFLDSNNKAVPKLKFPINGKNVLIEFNNGDKDKCSSFGESADKDVFSECPELTPCKRLSDEVGVDFVSENLTSKLNKSIKQEPED